MVTFGFLVVNLTIYLAGYKTINGTNWEGCMISLEFAFKVYE